MSFLRRGSLFFVVLALGCSSASVPTDDAGTSSEDASVPTDTADAAPSGSDAGSLADALEGAGFDLAPASFEAIDLAGCCDPDRSCSGNNPTSPYLAVYAPRGPGQTDANTAERSDGTSGSYRLRADEAIVIVGTTPPPAAYFGLTPYMMTRADATGARSSVFASLSETLNDAVITTSGATAFSAPFAVIATGDATTDASVRAALIASGVDDAAINTVTFDPTVVRFGLGADDDELGLLFRYALPEDATAGAAWVTSPGAMVLRVTPRTPTTTPLPAPLARSKGTAVEGATLAAALDRLEAALRADSASRTIRDFTVTDGDVDPSMCIAGLSSCAGDNRDTIYPHTGVFVLGRGDSVWVFGVNHAATGKATYANASVYSIDHLAGLAGVSSRAWAGSAERWLPGDPDAGSLFAWRIARDCGTDTDCLEIPTTECPTGAPYAAALTIAFRAYLEPGTGTGPDASTLVRERAFLVQAP
jgi:hypothetical protein